MTIEQLTISSVESSRLEKRKYSVLQQESNDVLTLRNEHDHKNHKHDHGHKHKNEKQNDHNHNHGHHLDHGHEHDHAHTGTVTSPLLHSAVPSYSSSHDHEHEHGHEHSHEHGHDHNLEDKTRPLSSYDLFNRDSGCNSPHSQSCGFSDCAHTAMVPLYHPHDSDSDIGNLDEQDNRENLERILRYSTADSCGDHAGLTLGDVLEAETLRDLISAYALEISAGVHSIIIGVDLGLLGSGDCREIIVLTVVLSFHQFTEGFGLGSVIGDARNSLGDKKIQWFIAIFSSTSSLGVIIGLLTSSQGQSDSDEAASAIASSIAAGSMLYIVLTEMVTHYFNRKDILTNVRLKAMMILSFTLGFAIMAIIGIWV